MTNMNPLRDNELAAQERVVQLEKELKEKNELIEKLSTKKTKAPRQWPKKAGVLVGKTLSVFLKVILPVAAVLAGLAYLFEPNEELIADGFILNVRAQLKKAEDNKCSLTKNKTGEFINVTCNNESDKPYGVEVSFKDKHGKKNTFTLNPLETLGSWDSFYKFSYHRLTSRCEMLYLGEEGKKTTPYSGCKVKVHYKLGKWLGDHSWVNNFVDASMCNKTDASPSRPSIKSELQRRR